MTENTYTDAYPCSEKDLCATGTNELLRLYKKACRAIYDIDRYCKRKMKQSDFLESREWEEVRSGKSEFTNSLSAIADELLKRDIVNLGLEKHIKTNFFGKERTYLITFDEKTNTCLGIAYDPEKMATSYALIKDGDTLFEDGVTIPPKNIIGNLVTIALLPDSILPELQEILDNKENRNLCIYDALEIVLEKKSNGRFGRIRNSVSQIL